MLKAAAILTPKQHIFLLSHMRAYTSLFGHIMGSNPAICGYYEMHIGYHSWRSLIRQKLLYFQNEEVKPGFSSMFDKVLHDDHSVNQKILNSSRAKTIFCLRRPEESIPSIMRLYNGVDPTHDFNSESFATSYYVRRLSTLQSIAESLEQGFFYFDAESLKNRPDECLGELSDWLRLEIHLSPNYKLQRNTSKERFGDTSHNIGTGHISTKTSKSHNSFNNVELLNTAERAYGRTRKFLIEQSAQQCAADYRE
jgi:hypothetical protein